MHTLWGFCLHFLLGGHMTHRIHSSIQTPSLHRFHGHIASLCSLFPSAGLLLDGRVESTLPVLRSVVLTGCVLNVNLSYHVAFWITIHQCICTLPRPDSQMLFPKTLATLLCDFYFITAGSAVHGGICVMTMGRYLF